MGLLLEAVPGPMDAVITALTTALSSIATSALGAVASILPIVLPICGAILVVYVGFKLFKRFAKA